MTAQLGLNYFGGNLFAQPYIIYEAGPQTYNRSIVDSIGALDLITRLADANRTLIINEGLTDSSVGQSAYNRTFADSVGLTDALIAGIIIVVHLVDDVGLTDRSTSAIALNVQVSDSVGLVDAVNRTVSAYRTHLDSLGITDSLTKLLTYNAYIVDSVALSDVLAYAGHYTKDVPKLMKTLDFKPIGMVESSKAKAKIILVSKPKWS